MWAKRRVGFYKDGTPWDNATWCSFRLWNAQRGPYSLLPPPRQHQQQGRLRRPKRLHLRHHRPQYIGVASPIPSTLGGSLSSLRTIVGFPACSRSPFHLYTHASSCRGRNQLILSVALPPVEEGLGYAAPPVGEGCDMSFNMYSLDHHAVPSPVEEGRAHSGCVRAS